MFGLAAGLHMATLARVLIGIGTAGVWIPSLKYLAISYRPDRFASMMGIINAIGGLGLVLTTFPMAMMVERIGWRHPKFWRFALWAFLIYGVLFSFQSL